MASFLDDLIGTVNTPSNAFNYGAAAANALYPFSQGFNAGDASSLSAVIAQMQDEADRQYNLQKQQLDNNYRVALMNARTQQDVAKANADYQQGQLQLARDRLEFDRQTQAQEFGLKQANLGYNLLGTLSQLKGPADYFQASNYARGVANNPGSSAFLTALQNNARLPGFGAQQAIPQPETAATLMAKLGGTFQPATGGTTNASGLNPSGGGGNNIINGTVLSASSAPMAATPSAGTALSPADQLQAQAGAIYGAGAHKLAPGALEQLTPTELGLLQSGIEASGGDWPTFLSQYSQSRIGQGFAGNKAA